MLRVVALLVGGVLWMAAAAGVQPVQAQNVPARIEAYALADSVAVGERFQLLVIAEHQFGVDVVFPEADAGPLIFGDVQVLERGEVEGRYLGQDGPGMRVDSVLYTVTTFALDSARVPALPVKVIPSGGDTLTGGTQPLTVPVRSTLDPEADGLRDLAPLAPLPQPLWPWILLGVAVAAMIGGLVYWWWMRRQPEPKPQVSPYEQANNRLDALAAADLEGGDLKPFFVDLSKALRSYLGARLGVSALESTTRELIRTLRSRPDVPEQVVERVRSVLQLADLVKFARSKTAPEEARAALQKTRAVVDTLESIRVRDAEENGSPSRPRPVSR